MELIKAKVMKFIKTSITLLFLLSFAGIAYADGWVDDGIIIRLNTSTDLVGIGTSSPGYKLEVAGNVSLNNTLVVTTESRVGIGTTAPETKLDIASGNVLVDNNKGYYGELTSGSNYRLLYIDTSDTWAVGSSGDNGGYLISGGPLYFQPGVATKMTLLTNGNVGIGTTSPSPYRLKVAGNVSVNSGTNVVYRCTSSGTLPVGTLTINSSSCGATADTGLRV